jgi:hypothetical protein
VDFRLPKVNYYTYFGFKHPIAKLFVHKKLFVMQVFLILIQGYTVLFIHRESVVCLARVQYNILHNTEVGSKSGVFKLNDHTCWREHLMLLHFVRILAAHTTYDINFVWLLRSSKYLSVSRQVNSLFGRGFLRYTIKIKQTFSKASLNMKPKYNSEMRNSPKDKFWET